MNTVSYAITGGDFDRVGLGASNLKERLKMLGIPPDSLRRVVIAAYEAEANVVVHAQKGTLCATLGPTGIDVEVTDEGPGIPDIALALAVERLSTALGLRKEGFQAILIAAGAHKPVRPRITGADGEAACLDAVDFLKEVKLGNRNSISGDVLVVGCTHSALDAARTAIRLGCSSAGLVYSRDNAQLPFEEAELRAAEEEGVTIHSLHHATDVLRTNGRVTGLECLRCTPKPVAWASARWSRSSRSGVPAGPECSTSR